MRSEEQLSEILRRSDWLKRKRAAMKRILSYCSGIIICLICMILTAVYVPAVTEGAGSLSEMRYGSLILSTGNMGYVIIAFLAFILGILITLLCVHLRELNKSNKIEK